MKHNTQGNNQAKQILKMEVMVPPWACEYPVLAGTRYTFVNGNDFIFKGNCSVVEMMQHDSAAIDFITCNEQYVHINPLDIVSFNESGKVTIPHHEAVYAKYDYSGSDVYLELARLPSVGDLGPYQMLTSNGISSPICDLPYPPFHFGAKLQLNARDTTYNQTHEKITWTVPGIPCLLPSMEHIEFRLQEASSEPQQEEEVIIPPKLIISEAAVSGSNLAADYLPVWIIIGLYGGFMLIIALYVAIKGMSTCCRKQSSASSTSTRTTGRGGSRSTSSYYT